MAMARGVIRDLRSAAFPFHSMCPHGTAVAQGGIEEEARRSALRHRSQVALLLNLWWRTAIGVSWSAEVGHEAAVNSGGAGGLECDRYRKICRKLLKALYEIYDPKDGHKTAEEQWSREMQGRPVLFQTDFEDGLLTLASAWTVGNDVGNLVAFLWTLFLHVAHVPSTFPGRCTWRDDSEISFAGFRYGQFAFAWGAAPPPIALPLPPMPSATGASPSAAAAGGTQAQATGERACPSGSSAPTGGGAHASTRAQQAAARRNPSSDLGATAFRRLVRTPRAGAPSLRQLP